MAEQVGPVLRGTRSVSIVVDPVRRPSEGRVQEDQATEMAEATLFRLGLCREPRSFSMAFMPAMDCSGDMSAYTWVTVSEE